jgi:molybdopterin-containing oxidoreductase family iron-sulfur binding subunit
MPLTVQMQQNPDVTVRFRGVMEKCSFCVQRIREANKYASIEDRTIQDGEVVTACQQSCPAQAITFGDISDPNTEVSQLRMREGGARRFQVLEELAVRPRVSYLARVRNPHPALAAADPFRARDLEPTVPRERVGEDDHAS